MKAVIAATEAKQRKFNLKKWCNDVLSVYMSTRFKTQIQIYMFGKFMMHYTMDIEDFVIFIFLC